jgi:hypothetical protein
MIWRQPAKKPHHFDVAVALPFQSTRGSHTVEVTADVQFEQVSRIIGRTAHPLWLGFRKAQRRQIQAPDPGIDYPYKRIGPYQIIEHDGKQCRLRPAFASSMCHLRPPKKTKPPE